MRTKVKALDWQRYERGLGSYATTLLGTYSVWPTDSVWGWDRDDIEPRFDAATEEAAKAAAQSHFGAAIASVLEDDWQTMETAPKDGTEILAYWDSDIYGVVWFEEGNWHEYEFENIVREPRCWSDLPSPPKAGE